jgi:hypothetical protein
MVNEDLTRVALPGARFCAASRGGIAAADVFARRSAVRTDGDYCAPHRKRPAATRTDATLI